MQWENYLCCNAPNDTADSKQFYETISLHWESATLANQDLIVISDHLPADNLIGIQRAMSWANPTANCTAHRVEMELQ